MKRKLIVDLKILRSLGRDMTLLGRKHYRLNKRENIVNSDAS